MKEKILIVDDEEEIRELIAFSIERALVNPIVMQCGDGQEAYDCIQKEKIDLLITDVKMPKMGGTRLVASVNNLPAEQKPTHMIVISILTTPQEEPKVINGTSFFPKPWDASQLETHIRHLFGLVAIDRPAGKKTEIDQSVIDVFLEATIQVLTVTGNISVQPDGVFMKQPDTVSGDISAIIPMNSKEYTGSMSISFTTPAFLELAEGMVGGHFTEITSDIESAAGELCNQLYGLVKRNLNRVGHSLAPAIPSIISGPNHKIRHLVQGPCYTLQFQVGAGTVRVEVVISPKLR